MAQAMQPPPVSVWTKMCGGCIGSGWRRDVHVAEDSKTAAAREFKKNNYLVAQSITNKVRESFFFYFFFTIALTHTHTHTHTYTYTHCHGWVQLLEIAKLVESKGEHDGEAEFGRKMAALVNDLKGIVGNRIAWTPLDEWDIQSKKLAEFMTKSKDVMLCSRSPHK